MSMLGLLLSNIEQGRIPDGLVRLGIRQLLRRRLAEIDSGSCEEQQERFVAFREDANRQQVALVPEKANEQHYEWPAGFFEKVLGHRLKYSCCLWGDGIESLNEAEDAALQTTCERADLEDGQRILELGCGWGSLSLWMAKHYPNSSITSVSNSHGQRQFIENRARQQGLTNLQVVTADMNDFRTDEFFDRAVSVEMFEHMRNHPLLLQRIRDWLRPGGKLLVHIFCHRQHAYLFETEGEHNWMGRYFFSGGMMPSDHLLVHCQQDLQLSRQWRWSGHHYERTSNAWLENLDRHRDAIRRDLEEQFQPAEATVWINRWRMFFMACAELFGFHEGNEWYVSHYLFERSSRDLPDGANVRERESQTVSEPLLDG